MISNSIRFRLLHQDLFPNAAADAETDSQLHRACLIPTKEAGYVLASCFSDNPADIQLSFFKEEKLQTASTLTFPDYIIHLHCIQLSVKEKNHICQQNPSFKDTCLLAVLTRKGIYFYDASLGALLEKFAIFFPRSLRYIPLELKRPSSQTGCDGMLAVITTNKVFLFDWMRRKLVMNLQASGISDFDFCRTFNGSGFFAGVLSTYRKPSYNPEDEEYGQLMTIYNLKTRKQARSIYLGSFYGSYNLIFTEVSLQGGTRKGLYLCLVNNFMQIVWNLTRGETIFKSTLMNPRLEKALLEKPITSWSMNALRMKEINGFGAIYEVKVDTRSTSKEKSEETNEVLVYVKNIKSPNETKIVSFFESEYGSVVISGIEGECEAQKEIAVSPKVSLYEIFPE